jgi:hypothetical protein
MNKSFDKLHTLASRLAELDDKIIEVFIHSDAPTDPLKNEEIYLVCHLADPRITNDIDYYNEESFSWGLDMAEQLEPLKEELDIQNEIIISPFNFHLHLNDEYGEYYHTLFIKEGFTPILELADEQKKEREKKVLDNAEGMDD